ncbi:4642_t:CDS:2, partial [Racocetra persica]
EDKDDVMFPAFSICHSGPHSTIKDVSCSVRYVNDRNQYNLYNSEIKFWETGITGSNEPCNENVANLTDPTGCYIFQPTINFTPFLRILQAILIPENASDLYSNDTRPAFIILNITLNDKLFWNNSLLNYIGIHFNEVIYKSERISVDNFYPISLGQHTILEFSITIIKKYTSYLIGQLGFKPDKTNALLNIETKILQSDSNSSNIFLAIVPKNNRIRIEEEKYLSNFGTILSSLGGFYTAISTVFIFCFGKRRYSPWGICRTCPCWWPYRQSFKKHLARRYISRAGIPLVDDPRKLPHGATIEDRIAVLECLLREYYLDTSFLEDIQKTRNRYIAINKFYKMLEPEINDDSVE